MSAIFGFTFHMSRMTEVLTPDIYIYIYSSLRDFNFAIEKNREIKVARIKNTAKFTHAKLNARQKFKIVKQ